MVRASILCLLIAVGLAAAATASGDSSDSRGLQRIPRISYASVLHNDHAKPRQRFKLRLFTRDARPGVDLISATYKGKRAIATYHGPNRAFGEWRVTRRHRDGRKLISRLVARLRKKGRVTFTAHVRSPGAVAPTAYKCKVRGYDSLGSCSGSVVALRGG